MKYLFTFKSESKKFSITLKINSVRDEITFRHSKSNPSHVSQANFKIEIHKVNKGESGVNIHSSPWKMHGGIQNGTITDTKND